MYIYSSGGNWLVENVFFTDQVTLIIVGSLAVQHVSCMHTRAVNWPGSDARLAILYVNTCCVCAHEAHYRRARRPDAVWLGVHRCPRV